MWCTLEKFLIESRNCKMEIAHLSSVLYRKKEMLFLIMFFGNEGRYLCMYLFSLKFAIWIGSKAKILLPGNSCTGEFCVMRNITHNANFSQCLPTTNSDGRYYKYCWLVSSNVLQKVSIIYFSSVNVIKSKIE